MLPCSPNKILTSWEHQEKKKIPLLIQRERLNNAAKNLGHFLKHISDISGVPSTPLGERTGRRRLSAVAPRRVDSPACSCRLLHSPAFFLMICLRAWPHVCEILCYFIWVFTLFPLCSLLCNNCKNCQVYHLLNQSCWWQFLGLLNVIWAQIINENLKNGIEFQKINLKNTDKFIKNRYYSEF